MENKQYKTWEMMKRLSERKEKDDLVFINQHGVRLGKSANGFLEILEPCPYKKFSLDSNVDLDDAIWTEVSNEPLTFIDVVNSSKDCLVKHDLLELKISEETFESLQRYLPLDTVMYKLSLCFKESDLKEVILNGEWYLKR